MNEEVFTLRAVWITLRAVQPSIKQKKTCLDCKYFSSIFEFCVGGLDVVGNLRMFLRKYVIPYLLCVN